MFAALLLLAVPPVFAPDPASVVTQKVIPMDDARFWSIVERSALNAASQDEQEAHLRGILAGLPVADLLVYQAAYDAKRAVAYRWELWGAAYVIHGGASDDGFDYFRSWLISRGRRTFDAALADPDSLATTIPADIGEPAEFEGFGYIAVDLWAKRTGGNPAKIPTGSVTQPAEPAGQPFSEDPKTLAARYPKLWKRFGNAPLG
jgi:hypothetical protein